MRKLAATLLGGAYLFAACALAALFWVRGAGWGAGAAVLVGSLALFTALHAVIGRVLDLSGLRSELAAIRDAHRILADHLEETEGALEELASQLQFEALGKTAVLTSEVRMLEDLVSRMGEDLGARLAEQASAPAAATPAARQDSARIQVIRDALLENRVDLYFQPVVSLPQRRTAYYESFTRLRDATGRVIMPAEYLQVAEPEGLISAIDNLLLFRCVQIVRRLGKGDRRVGVFCNISPASLADDRFFPQFLDFMSDNRDLAGALIFELGQSAFRERTAVQARNMARLADLGFRFSLDKMADLKLDLPDMERAEVRYVKVSAPVLLEELAGEEALFAPDGPRGGRRDVAAADYAALLRRHGVELVAEKVEAERQVINVLELDIALGQGNLFGEPRPIRDEVLAETTPPPEFVRAPLRRAG